MDLCIVVRAGQSPASEIVYPSKFSSWFHLCQLAAKGNVEARRLAKELDEALIALSTYDEGPDLVLYYKHLLCLQGHSDYELHFNETDSLSESQTGFVEAQLKLFLDWWRAWPGKTFCA